MFSDCTLVSLVPKPRFNLTRFHGVFAPNSKHRVQVTPAKRGKGKKPRLLEENQTPAERREAMTWAKRLKRVFTIDIETCSECCGDVKIIASKKWTMPIHNWNLALSQLAIFFEGRLDEALDL